MTFPVRPLVTGTPAIVGTTAEVSDNDLLPWHVNIHPGQGVDAYSPAITSDALPNASWPQGFLSYTNGNGSWMECSTYLAAGTWTLVIPYDKRNDYPMVQASFNGVNVGPLVDRYIASGSSGVNGDFVIVTGLVVDKPKLCTVRVTTNGKNAAATTSYTLTWSGCYLTRTA